MEAPSAHIRNGWKQTINSEVKGENISGAKPSKGKKLIRLQAKTHNVPHRVSKENKRNKQNPQNGQMACGHVTSVDGFKRTSTPNIHKTIPPYSLWYLSIQTVSIWLTEFEIFATSATKQVKMVF